MSGYRWKARKMTEDEYKKFLQVGPDSGEMKPIQTERIRTAPGSDKATEGIQRKPHPHRQPEQVLCPTCGKFHDIPKGGTVRCKCGSVVLRLGDFDELRAKLAETERELAKHRGEWKNVCDGMRAAIDAPDELEDAVATLLADRYSWSELLPHRTDACEELRRRTVAIMEGGNE